MKNLFFILTVFIGSTSWSQEKTLELNSNQEYEYIEVLQFDSISKSVLYNNTLKWISSAYKNPEKAITFRDEGAGSIVIVGVLTCTTYALSGGYINYRLQIDFKDGKIRTTWDNFSYMPGNMQKQPFESNSLWKKDQMLSDTRYDVDALISSLKTSIIEATTIKSGDDW
jgi:hypothetical protein